MTKSLNGRRTKRSRNSVPFTQIGKRDYSIEKWFSKEGRIKCDNKIVNRHKILYYKDVEEPKDLNEQQILYNYKVLDNYKSLYIPPKASNYKVINYKANGSHYKNRPFNHKKHKGILLKKFSNFLTAPSPPQDTQNVCADGLEEEGLKRVARFQGWKQIPNRNHDALPQGIRTTNAPAFKDGKDEKARDNSHARSDKSHSFPVHKTMSQHKRKSEVCVKAKDQNVEEEEEGRLVYDTYPKNWEIKLTIKPKNHTKNTTEPVTKKFKAASHVVDATARTKSKINLKEATTASDKVPTGLNPSSSGGVPDHVNSSSLIKTQSSPAQNHKALFRNITLPSLVPPKKTKSSRGFKNDKENESSQCDEVIEVNRKTAMRDFSRTTFSIHEALSGLAYTGFRECRKARTVEGGSEEDLEESLMVNVESDDGGRDDGEGEEGEGDDGERDDCERNDGERDSGKRDSGGRDSGGRDSGGRNNRSLYPSHRIHNSNFSNDNPNNNNTLREDILKYNNDMKCIHQHFNQHNNKHNSKHNNQHNNKHNSKHNNKHNSKHNNKHNNPHNNQHNNHQYNNPHYNNPQYNNHHPYNHQHPNHQHYCNNQHQPYKAPNYTEYNIYKNKKFTPQQNTSTSKNTKYMPHHNNSNNDMPEFHHGSSTYRTPFKLKPPRDAAYRYRDEADESFSSPLRDPTLMDENEKYNIAHPITYNSPFRARYPDPVRDYAPIRTFENYQRHKDPFYQGLYKSFNHARPFDDDYLRYRNFHEPTRFNQRRGPTYPLPEVPFRERYYPPPPAHHYPPPIEYERDYPDYPLPPPEEPMDLEMPPYPYSGVYDRHPMPYPRY